jgi:hypothetical protein
MAFQLASLDESGVVNIWVRHLVYYIFCSFPHFSLKILFWNIFSNLFSVLYNAYFPYEKFPKLWRYYRYHRQILLWGGGDQEGAEKSRGGMPKNQEGVRKLQQESKRGTGTTGGNCSIYSVIGYNSWIFGISAYRPALIVRQLYVKVHE